MTNSLSPDHIYRALHEKTGGQLFTVTVLDRAAGLARRVYTSHPETYPVSGTKPMQQGDWTRQVIENGDLFVANTVAEFAKYFPDYKVIESLGCESALNIPVVREQVIGTVNILEKQGYFTEEQIEYCTEAVQRSYDTLVGAFDQSQL